MADPADFIMTAQLRMDGYEGLPHAGMRPAGLLAGVVGCASYQFDKRCVLAATIGCNTPCRIVRGQHIRCPRAEEQQR